MFSFFKPDMKGQLFIILSLLFSQTLLAQSSCKENVDELDRRKETELFTAYHDIERAKWLISCGADVNFVKVFGPQGQARMPLVLKYFSNGASIEMYEVLAAAGVDFSAADDGGLTVLELAIVHKNEEVLNYLLDLHSTGIDVAMDSIKNTSQGIYGVTADSAMIQKMLPYMH